MIDWIQGSLVHISPSGVTVNVNGLGYGLQVPLPTLCGLPDVGGEITLWVHTRVREDAIQLYGFQRLEERAAFETLLQINRVGPRVALAALSTLSVESLVEAVKAENLGALQAVPGIGKASAERILVELKSKVDRIGVSNTALVGGTRVNPMEFAPPGFSESANSVAADLTSALENLGYKEKEAKKVVASIDLESRELSFSSALKVALEKIKNPKGSRNTVSVDSENLGRLF